jgi:hypothetical protein
VLRCVGNVWHRRSDDPALWLGEDGDEQPLDAAALAEALADAWAYGGDTEYAKLATTSFRWFLGSNRAGARLYVDATGACHDGLGAGWVNGNQGAESTLAYYQALLSLVRAGLVTLPEPRTRAGSQVGTVAREVGRSTPGLTTAVARPLAPPVGASAATGPVGPTGPVGTAGTPGGSTAALSPSSKQSPTTRKTARNRPTEGHTDAR